MNNYVKVTKINTVADPLAITAEPDEYKYGEENPLSPPLYYWVTGKLTHDPKIGDSITVMRDCRNGVKIGGFFQTSPVIKIEGNVYYTFNSVYRLEYVDKE